MTADLVAGAIAALVFATLAVVAATVALALPMSTNRPDDHDDDAIERREESTNPVFDETANIWEPGIQSVAPADSHRLNSQPVGPTQEYRDEDNPPEKLVIHEPGAVGEHQRFVVSDAYFDLYELR